MPAHAGNSMTGIVAEAMQVMQNAAHQGQLSPSQAQTEVPVDPQTAGAPNWAAQVPMPGTSLLEETHQSLLKADLKKYPALAVFPKSFAMEFDGKGGAKYTSWAPYKNKEQPPKTFTWHHIVLPRQQHRLGHYVMEVMLPLGLHCHDILPLMESGPFCGVKNEAVLFRINSVGPVSSNFTSKTASWLTPSSVVTVSMYDLPRLALLGPDSGSDPTPKGPYAEGKLLDTLLQSGQHGYADQPAPFSSAGVVAHLLTVLLDHLKDLTTVLELDLDVYEADIDTDTKLKRRLLEDRRFSKMSLDLQRQLQITMFLEEVLPTLKSRLTNKGWCSEGEPASFDDILKRLHNKRERIGIMMNRISALQASLRDWQSSLTNDTLFYLTIATVLAIPLSVLTGAFGMNVTGVPFVDGSPGPGFRNVCLICLGVVIFLSVLFAIPPALEWVNKRRKRQAVQSKWKKASSRVLQNVRGVSVTSGAGTPGPASGKSVQVGGGVTPAVRKKSLWDNVV